MEQVERVLEDSHNHTHSDGGFTGGEFYENSYVRELHRVVEGALSAGANPMHIHRLISRKARKDLEDDRNLWYNCSFMLDALFTGMLRMDRSTLVDGQSPLHYVLSISYPPPLVAPEYGSGDKVTLLEFIRATTPNARNSAGETALHVLIRRADKNCEEEESPDLLKDVGRALLDRGWTLDVADGKGRTPRALLQKLRDTVERTQTRFKRKPDWELVDDSRFLNPTQAKSMQRAITSLLGGGGGSSGAGSPADMVLSPAKAGARQAQRRFAQGESIRSVATKRARPIQEQSVVCYLAEAAAAGMEVNWSRLVQESRLEESAVGEIKEAIEAHGDGGVDSVKRVLPGTSYGHIKLVAAMMKCKAMWFEDDSAGT